MSWLERIRRTRLRWWAGGVALATGAAAVVAVAGPAHADVTGVSGGAVGIESTLLGQTVIPPTPTVTLPPGGNDSAVNVPGVVGVFNASSSSQNVPGPNGTATSSASAANLDLGGMLTATAVESTCTSGSNGSTANVTLVGATFGGMALPANPAPNTPITVPGVGSVVLNEQTLSNSPGTTSITVNALHVTLLPATGAAAGADAIVAQAACGATGPDVNPGPTTTTSTTAPGTTSTTAPSSTTSTTVPGTTSTTTPGTTSTTAPPANGPSVGGVTPNSGPQGGTCTLVTITGTGFTGATEVNFGTAPATNFSVASDTEIRATAPPGAGVVDVTVTTPRGTSPVTSVDRFTYTSSSTGFFTRLAGSDRYATAAAVAHYAFSCGASTAIIATGDNFPDALAGSYLAGSQAAPILLTTTSAPVPQPTLDALSTLKVKNVILLGGYDAISPNVQAQLAATPSSAPSQSGNLTVSRIAGPNRYDTMGQVAARPGVAHVGTVGGKRTAVIADGLNFPDALSAGPISYRSAFPVILTDPDGLTPEAAQALTGLSIQQVLVEGGTAAVSANVEHAINAMGIPTLQRFEGRDRSMTSQLTADYAATYLGYSPTHFDVATGLQALGGADSLSGGPLGGVSAAPQLITLSADNPGHVTVFAQEHCRTEVSGVALGGTNALSDASLSATASAAHC